MSGPNPEAYPFNHPSLKVREDVALNLHYQGIAAAVSSGYVATLDDIWHEFNPNGDSPRGEKAVKRFISYVHQGRFYQLLGVPIYLELFTNKEGKSSLLFYDWRQRGESDFERSIAEAMERPIIRDMRRSSVHVLDSLVSASQGSGLRRRSVIS